MSVAAINSELPMVVRGLDAGEVSSQASPVSFIIPTPPSVNKLFRNVKGKGRVKTSKYDEWRREAVAAIRRQKVGRLAGNVIINIGVERMSDSADLDNRIKPAFDAIVTAGTITDDSRVIAFSAAWLPMAGANCHVEIRTAAPGAVDATLHVAANGASAAWILPAPFSEGDDDHGDFAE